MSPQSDALNWNQKRKLLKYFEPSIKQHPDWPVIISEGDSWNGGGNDIVGADLLPLLNQKKPGMQWQDCINRTTTDARLDRLKSAYLDLIHLRDENRPGCRIYVHGYDWGSWGASTSYSLR